jgi:nucleoside-diphosphate-sugar epimerase
MSQDTFDQTHLEAGTSIVVTGAGGGVGRHVVRRALDAGLRVRAVDRLSATEVELHGLFDPHEDVDWRYLELSAANLDAVVDGCSAVVHTAAWVSLSETYPELAGVNVELVRDLYAAASRNDVEHVVHFSCGAIYRAQSGLRHEDDPLEASNAFEQTKIDSESIFPDDLDAGGSARWTILRPALIYGPHCSKMGASIATIPPIVRGFMPYLPGITGGQRTNWCYVEDAASAVMAVLGNDAAYQRTFNVADDTPLGFGEVMTTITEAYGLEVGPLVPFPNTALWTALSPLIDRDWVFDLARQVLRGLWNRLQHQQGLHSPLRPRVDRNALFYVEKDNILGADALKELGWRAKYTDFRQGIFETVRWYQEHDWAPRFDTETRVRLKDQKQNLGFGFRELLQGRWHHAKTGQTGRARLMLDAEFPNVGRLALDLEGNIDGTLTLDGLVEHADIRGTIRIRLLSEDGIHYEMGFDDADGHPHRMALSRTVDPMHPLASLTEVDGVVIGSDGESVGEVDFEFEPRSQLVPLIASIRIVH